MFEIDCGAGYLRVKGVEGLKQVEVNATLVTKGIEDDDLEVDDGSGGIVIDGVDKDVNIKSAGSGSLTIRNVKGKVTK